ncbi:restriction endonuclease subunit S [bacterium]|nr:restriction endonuclease subunit S [bacterium]
MVQDMSIEINATLDCEQYLCNDKINVIYELEKEYDMKFILALLNSKLINFWFRKLFTSGFEIKLNQLETIPIPVATKEQQKQIVELVDEILRLKSQNDGKMLVEQVSALEAEIDRQVYELYGLTDDEIAIVEGRN